MLSSADECVHVLHVYCIMYKILPFLDFSIKVINMLVPFSHLENTFYKILRTWQLEFAPIQRSSISEVGPVTAGESLLVKVGAPTQLSEQVEVRA